MTIEPKEELTVSITREELRAIYETLGETSGSQREAMGINEESFDTVYSSLEEFFNETTQK